MTSAPPERPGDGTRDVPTDPPDGAPTRPGVAPADTPGELVLSHALEMLAPLVRLLVSQGVGYPRLAQALKQVFMQAALEELHREGRRVTDAAISVRSGVHRKDVRAAGATLASTAAASAAAASDASASAAAPSDATSGRRRGAGSVADQVYTRWTTDAAYRDADGRPSALPLAGPAPSFDTLVSAVTRDLSRRTVLDELVRLGLAREHEGRVEPLADAAIPRADLARMLEFLSDHVHDHLAAGEANLRAARAGDKPPFLEHALYANGLSDASIEQLRQLAVQLWRTAFGQIAEAARQRHAIDREHGRDGRLRFGVYFYSEPASGDDAGDPPAEPRS